MTTCNLCKPVENLLFHRLAKVCNLLWLCVCLYTAQVHRFTHSINSFIERSKKCKKRILSFRNDVITTTQGKHYSRRMLKNVMYKKQGNHSLKGQKNDEK